MWDRTGPPPRNAHVPVWSVRAEEFGEPEGSCLVGAGAGPVLDWEEGDIAGANCEKLNDVSGPERGQDRRKRGTPFDGKINGCLKN